MIFSHIEIYSVSSLRTCEYLQETPELYIYTYEFNERVMMVYKHVNPTKMLPLGPQYSEIRENNLMHPQSRWLVEIDF